MTSHQYLYLSSDDSLNYFPANSPSNFTVKMLSPLIFRCNQFIGLLAFQYCDLFTNKQGYAESANRNIYICSDICQQSFVKDRMLPVLTRLYIDSNNDSAVKEVTITNPIYIPIVQYFSQDLHIYITDDYGEIISLSNGPTKLTLHVKSS